MLGSIRNDDEKSETHFAASATRGASRNPSGALRVAPRSSPRDFLGRSSDSAEGQARQTAIASRNGSERGRTRCRGPRCEVGRIPFRRLLAGNAQGPHERLLRPRGAGIAKGTQTEGQRGGDGGGDGHRAARRGPIPRAANGGEIRHEDFKLGEDSRRHPGARRRPLLRPPLRPCLCLPQRGGILLRRPGVSWPAASVKDRRLRSVGRARRYSCFHSLDTGLVWRFPV